MKYCLLLVQMLALAAAAAPAKTPAKPALPPGNRFLFVFETSAAMARLEHGGRQTVFDLVFSGADGNMRKGDTYGIWTFNEQVYAGFYPMQTWDGTRQLEHASAVGRFLKGQKYEKDGNATNLVKQLQALLRVAKDLNILIITDGKTPLSGTAFDESVNDSYRAHTSPTRSAKQPLVTTLTARNGEFTGASVTATGEQIIIADLAEPVTNTEAQTARTAPPPEKAPSPPKERPSQVVAVTDTESEAARESTLPTTPENSNAAIVKVNRPITNGATPRMIVINKQTTRADATDEPPAAAPVVAMTATTNAAKPEVTNAAALVVKTPPAVTNEAPKPGPEPLPAIVPAQMKVSAKTLPDPMIVMASPANAQRPSSTATLMLIVGGGFVGASVLGGVLFMRRMRRAARQPSFISLGMDKQ